MPRRPFLLLLGALGLVAVVAVGGLGLVGGDDEPKLTSAQLAERVDGVCGRLTAANLALRPPPKPYDLQSTEFFDRMRENVERAHDQLDELSPPDAAAADVDALVDALHLIAVKVEEAAGAASLEHGTEIDALIVEIRRLVRDAIARERALGVCEGRKSTRTSIAAAIVRTRENPLTETGPLIP